MSSEHDPAASSGLKAGDLTLRDLLEGPAFGLELITGSDGRLSQPIRGAHSTEVPNPTRWLDQGWVLLCAATAIPSVPDAQRRLIGELDAAGIVGLGLGLGELHASVPPELVEAAERIGFPIFVVPSSTPFREIITHVTRGLMSEEVRAFARMTAIQRFLMDSIGEPQPIHTAIERLAQVLNAKVGLLLPTGKWEVSTADMPAREILQVVSERQALSRVFAVAGLEGHALAIRDAGGTESSWLVIAVREGGHLHPLALAAGNATVPLVAAIRRMNRAQRSVDDAARQATLDGLISASTAADAQTLAAQCAAWGLEVSAGVVAIVVEDPTGRVDAEMMKEHVMDGRDRWAPDLTATVHDGRLRVLVQAPVTGDALRAHLMSFHADLRAGIGRTVSEPLDIGRSVSEAELALRAPAPGDRVIGRFDDLDLGTVLLHELPLDRLRPKVTAWLEPLRENPRVYETLVAYLEHDLDVGQTALALHLHPNSVRYRLGRAEALIGAPIRSPTSLIALQVALVSGLGVLDDSGAS